MHDGDFITPRIFFGAAAAFRGVVCAGVCAVGRSKYLYFFLSLFMLIQSGLNQRFSTLQGFPPLANIVEQKQTEETHTHTHEFENHCIFYHIGDLTAEPHTHTHTHTVRMTKFYPGGGRGGRRGAKFCSHTHLLLDSHWLIQGVNGYGLIKYWYVLGIVTSPVIGKVSHFPLKLVTFLFQSTVVRTRTIVTKFLHDGTNSHLGNFFSVVTWLHASRHHTLGHSVVCFQVLWNDKIDGRHPLLLLLLSYPTYCLWGLWVRGRVGRSGVVGIWFFFRLASGKGNREKEYHKNMVCLYIHAYSRIWIKRLNGSANFLEAIYVDVFSTDNAWVKRVNLPGNQSDQHIRVL